MKASSALTVANHIIDNMVEENIILSTPEIFNTNNLLDSISKNDIDKLAEKTVEQRGYPKALARLVIARE